MTIQWCVAELTEVPRLPLAWGKIHVRSSWSGWHTNISTQSLADKHQLTTTRRHTSCSISTATLLRLSRITIEVHSSSVVVVFANSSSPAKAQEATVPRQNKTCLTGDVPFGSRLSSRRIVMECKTILGGEYMTDCPLADNREADTGGVD